MTNTYRPVSEWAKATYGEDDFDADYTVEEERDNLDSGHLEIVPRAYVVTSDNYYVLGDTARDKVVELALPIETEAALISGGHIELSEESPPEDQPEDEEPEEVAEPTEEEE